MDKRKLLKRIRHNKHKVNHSKKEESRHHVMRRYSDCDPKVLAKLRRELKNKYNLYELRIIARDFHDINKAREERSIHKLKPSLFSSIVAYLRARQVRYVTQIKKDWSNQAVHNIKCGHGRFARTDVRLCRRFPSLSIDDFPFAENITEINLGHGQYNNGEYTDTLFSKSYDNKTPEDMADSANIAYIDYDESEKDGHCHNILRKNEDFVGTSAWFDPKTNEGIMVEEFGKNPY